MTTSIDCYPYWHDSIAPIAKGRMYPVNSGCYVQANGNVSCAPEQLRAQAEKYLQSFPIWGSKRLSIEAYTLGRYMASEVGDGTPEERVAVGEAAVNRARYLKLPRGVLDLLLYRQSLGHPNYGFYGPIHGIGTGVSTAPYGRWAATSQDPTVADLIMADMIMNGDTDDFSNGADDQDGLEYTAAFPDPAAKVRVQAARGSYWVGPLPGVDHWHTFLWRQYDVPPTSLLGSQLLQRGLEAVSSRQRPVWGALPICSRSSVGSVVALFGLGLVVGGFAFVFVRRRIRSGVGILPGLPPAAAA